MCHDAPVDGGTGPNVGTVWALRCTAGVRHQNGQGLSVNHSQAYFSDCTIHCTIYETIRYNTIGNLELTCAAALNRSWFGRSAVIHGETVSTRRPRQVSDEST